MTFEPSTEDAGTSVPAHDISITIVASPRKQVWANRVQLPNGLTSRAAGHIEKGFTVHSALTISAIGALRSLTRGKLKPLDTTERKPVVKLVTEDTCLAQSVSALSRNEPTACNLRASRPLLSELRRLASRYDIQVEVLAESDNKIQSLKGYAINSLAKQRNLFTPRLISERI